MGNIDIFKLNRSFSLNQWCCPGVIMSILLFALLFLSVNQAEAAMYLNSSEPQCNGSDPSVVLCDDFEDGSFYSMNCDAANVTGGLLQTDGWCGTIFAPITPENAATCGAAGAAGTNCSADSGPLGARDNGNMADHNLGPNGDQYDELYVRYYYKAQAGQLWGQHKALTFNWTPAGSGGITWGNFSFNCAGGLSSSPPLTMGIVAEDTCQHQNMGNNLPVVSGRWYLIEMRVKLNTIGNSDGVYQLWMDDCGTNGLGCTGSQTLRMNRTNVNWGKTLTTQHIRSLWWENWSNPRTQGREYYDQIVVATRRIGSMMGGDTKPPAAPTNLQVM